MAKTGAIRAGKAYVELGTDNKNLEKGLRAAQRRLREFGSSVRAAGMWLFAAGSAIIAPLGLAVREAMNATESLSKFQQVFGDQADAAGEFADAVAKAIGRSRIEIRDAMAAFQGFFVGLGFGSAQAREMSQKLEELSIDFASFHNISDPEAMQRFISALSGSSEVLDRFGINIKQAALQEEMLRMGVTKSWTAVTEQEKAVARLNVIMRAMGDQGDIGDAARTSGTLANQLKALRALIKDTSVDIGNALVPAISDIVRQLMPAIRGFGEWIRMNPSVVITIAKVGLALAAVGGIALIAGQGILVMSSALTAIVAIGPLVLGALAAIFSPAGLIAVGVVAAMVALTWLAGGFGILANAARAAAEDFRDCFASMGDALAAGDIGLAARIFWLTLKFEWTRGIGTLKGLWATFRYATLSTMATIVYGLRAEWEIGTHAILRITYGLARALRSVWRAFFDFFRTTHDAAVTWIAKRMIDVQGMFDKTLDTAAIKAGLDEQHTAFAAELDKQQAADEKRWDAEMARDQEAHYRRMAAIGEEADLLGGVVKQELLDRLSAIDDEVLAARRAWKQSQADARAAREKWKMEPPGAPPGGPALDISGIQDAIRNTISTIGAFQVESVLGLQAGSATDRMATGIDKIERNTRSLKDVDELAFT